jgi:hypothetical protein
VATSDPSSRTRRRSSRETDAHADCRALATAGEQLLVALGDYFESFEVTRAERDELIRRIARAEHSVRMALALVGCSGCSPERRRARP